MGKNFFEVWQIKRPLPLFLVDSYIEAEIERRNWHEEIELIYAAEGSGEIILDNKNIKIKENEFCIINSFQLHTAKSTNGLTFANIITNTDFLKNNGLDTTNYIYETIFTDEVAKEKLYELYDIYHGDTTSDFYYSKVCNSLLDFMIHITENHARKKPLSSSANNINFAIGYIKSNFNKKLTLDEVCAQSGLSKYYFSHEFKKATGYTFVDFVNFLRIHHACEQLRDKANTPKNVFEMSCFDNFSYFIKVFKKHMGITPSEYQKTIISDKII